MSTMIDETDNAVTQRVVEEKRQLDDKLKRLFDFIGSSEAYAVLNERHQRLLRDQTRAMTLYASILELRIELLRRGE